LRTGELPGVIFSVDEGPGSLVFEVNALLLAITSDVSLER
jgi:hypothetical protein